MPCSWSYPCQDSFGSLPNSTMHSYFSSCLYAYRPRYSHGPCLCLIELYWVISKLLDSCLRGLAAGVSKNLTYSVAHENLPRRQTSKLHYWTTINIQYPLELEICSPTELNLDYSPNSSRPQYLCGALLLTPWHSPLLNLPDQHSHHHGARHSILTI